MRRILLTNKAIESVDIGCGLREVERGKPNEGSYYYEHQLNKAQLKKIAEWGNEPCFEHRLGMDGLRRRCRECWQALLKECD